MSASKYSSSLAKCLLLLALAVPAWPQPPRNWSAQWIWDRAASASEKNVYSYFRKSFPLTGLPLSATLVMTADSRYQVFVNGAYVGRGPVRAPAGRLHYDTYDVKAHLRAGDNVVAVVVHYFGEGNESYFPGRGGLLLEADIIPAAGQAAVRLRTDASWRALRSAVWNSASPRENDSNGFVEIADLRQEPPGWKSAGYNDAAWSPPFLIGVPPQEPWPALVPRDIPALLETDLRPASVAGTAEVGRQAPANPLLAAEQVHTELFETPSTVQFGNLANLISRSGAPATVQTPVSGRDAAIVLDFGRVIAGFPYVEVEGPAGAVVDVTFSEWLGPDGRVPAKRSPVRFFTYVGNPAYTTDRIIVGAGRNRWQRFFHTGLRYLQLTIRDAGQPLTIHAAGAVFHTYPFLTRGSFRSSDPLLNAIWAVGAYTVQLSTADTFMDCPWREKGQWIDMVTPVVSYYAFGDRAILARFLRSTSFSQDADGRMYFPYPSTVAFEMPDQTMWWGMLLWSYYLHTGDASLLEELYPVLAKAEAWFKSKKSARGLLDVNWSFTGSRLLWPWIDHGHRWPNNLPGFKLGELAALDCFHYKFLNDAAAIARATNRTPDAARYEADAVQLKNAINAAYWDSAQDLYWDDPARTIKSPYASALAVLYGIAPAERAGAILDQLLDANYLMGAASPHFYSFVLEAFSRAGLHERALDAIRIRWGGLLGRGATTFWERWFVNVDLFGQPWPAGENHNISLTHGYSAGPTAYLSNTVLGIRPLAPGFTRFAVAPQLSGLEWAEGSVPTPFGRIQASWRLNAGTGFALTAYVPNGTAGVISLPRQSGDQVSVNGTVVWRAGAPTGTAPGSRVLGALGSRVLIESQPGSHQFLAQ